MTNSKREKYEEMIKAAKGKNVHLPDDFLALDENGNFRYRVCVYGFFATKESDEPECFYIGKTTVLVSRMLDYGGHLHRFLYEDEYNDKDYLVPQEIKNYLALGYEIQVKILADCDKDYEDTDFSRAAHRLALAEIQQIVIYQKKGQCLKQRPEGARQNQIAYWEENYKIK